MTCSDLPVDFGERLSICIKIGLLRELYEQSLITRPQFEQLMLLQRGQRDVIPPLP